MGKATQQGGKRTPVIPKIRDTSLSDATGCRGRTLNLAGISEEARKHHRHSQWVQNHLGGVLGDTASSEGPEAFERLSLI